MTSSTIAFGAVGRTGRWELKMSAPEPNPVPVRPLIFDYPPTKLLPTREVLAALVLSGAKGTYSFEKALPRRFKADLGALGIEIVSPDLPGEEQIDIRSTELVVAASTELPPSTPGRDSSLLILPPSERFQGRLKGVKELAVASNARWLSSLYGPRVLASCGVLYAADLLAKRIIVPHISNEADFNHLRDLLAIGGLDLAATPEGVINE